MSDDLISRSALLEQECFMVDDIGFRCSVVLSTDVRRAPAVDPVTAFKQIGLVKEAFEMAKSDLVTVVRCKDCKAWKTETAMFFLRDGVYVRCCSCGVYGRLMFDDDFCSKGKRRADDATN